METYGIFALEIEKEKPWQNKQWRLKWYQLFPVFYEE